MSREFVVLCGQVVGNMSDGFEVVYNFDGERFTSRKKAIRHGFKIRESDDFNIGVLDGGKLVSLDWMEKVVDTDPKLLLDIQEQIGIEP